MDFRWNQLNLTWVTSLNMTTQTSRKNSKHVNISSMTLSFKKEDIVFSISPCQPSTTLWLTRTWTYYSKDSNALTKLTVRLDLFSKTLKMDRVDIFMLKRTIRLWWGQTLCLHQTTLPTSKRNYRKGILLIFVHERESQYQMEVLQTDKSDSSRSATQRCTHGL